MPDTVIVSAVRTPIGRARKGAVNELDAVKLAEIAVLDGLVRCGVPAEEVDDLVLAEQLLGGGVMGRNVAVRVGLSGVTSTLRRPRRSRSGTTLPGSAE